MMVNVCVCSVAQLCPSLSDPMDCSLPGFSVHGIFQARVLEWVAISSSRASSQPRSLICISCHVSCVAGGFFTAEPRGTPMMVNEPPKCIYQLDYSHPVLFFFYPLSGCLLKGSKKAKFNSDSSQQKLLVTLIYLGIQLTLEQHQFEPWWSSYMWIFFSVVNTVILHVPWIAESTNTEPGIWRADNKWIWDCAEMPLSPCCPGELNPTIH